MNVDNIFDLLNQFDKEEDRISAGFGFLLKQNRKMLRAFLKKVNVTVSDRELKCVDIETQVTFDSGESRSRIDLQLTIYGNFLIFLESKIVRNEDSIIYQLNKYATILNFLRDQYNDRIRLVYVSKFLINPQKIKSMFTKIKLGRDKIFLFCWEDLLKLARRYRKGEIYKQFDTWMGDKMFSKKVIKEQKIKDIVEVLVIHTNEENWQLIRKKNLAVQGNGTPDAQYLAFYRTHRKDKQGNKLPQAITHIAEVISTETNVPRSKTVKGLPDLEKWYKQKRRPLSGRQGTHKHYNVGKLIELAREIPFIKGGKSIGQVKFKTKMSELLQARTVSDLKRLKDLEE